MSCEPECTVYRLSTVVPHDEVLDGDEIVELNPKSVTVMERPPRKRPPRDQAVRLAALEARREHEYQRICKGMSLCVAYAANIGGIGSVTGSSTNLITLGQIQQLYSKYGLDSGLNFSSWMAFALPSSFLTLIMAWLWLALLFIGPRKVFRLRRNKAQSENIKKMLSDEYERLGPTSFAEYALIGHFLGLVLLWLSRKPPTGEGWDSLFPDGYVGDSAAAVLVCVSMFIFPASRPRPFSSSRGEARALLQWGELQTKYPWGVLLLLGGGFALADVCQESGLSEAIGDQLAVIGHGLQPWLLNLVLTFTFSMATEVTSNAATAALLVPIVGQLALNLSINPLYLMLPAGLSTSFAFMLPVATAPNALVFAMGHLQVKDMVLAGVVLNVLAVAMLNLAVNTWGSAFFQWNSFPQALAANGSVAMATATPLNVSLANATVFPMSTSV